MDHNAFSFGIEFGADAQIIHVQIKWLNENKEKGLRAASLPESYNECKVWSSENSLSLVSFHVCPTRTIQSYIEFKSLGGIGNSRHTLTHTHNISIIQTILAHILSVAYHNTL